MMERELKEQVSTIHHAPLQVVSMLLLQIKFRWCPVGWTDWTLRQTKGARYFFKLLARALSKSQRKVGYWPTPIASSYERVRAKRSSKQVMLFNALAMEDPTLEGQAINPAWVEIQMGFPEGWTDLRESCDIRSLKLTV